MNFFNTKSNYISRIFCTGDLSDIQIKLNSRNVCVPTLLFMLHLCKCVKNVEKLKIFNANYLLLYNLVIFFFFVILSNIYFCYSQNIEKMLFYDNEPICDNQLE